MIALMTSAPLLRPALEVVDVSAQRADLARRREVKFTFMNADVEALRRLLEVNGRRQVFRREVSVVHSVYFDDVALSACRANLDGLGRRNMVRLRWYDRPLPANECFLEIKWRQGRVTGKHRLRVCSEQVLGTQPYRHILAQLTEAAPRPYLPFLVRYCEPVLLVRYRREHFVSPDAQMRVTIDYDITYFDQTGKQRISTSFGQRHEGLVVLEGKVPPGCELELRNFLYPFAGRAERCSKYVHGCERMGLI
jgi:hypothetical protein